ncbi:MAG: hypothetical protein ACOCP7_02675 [Desulfohalobiaceae bacterium]
MTNHKKNNYQCLADSLAQESLTEAAEHFFGQRVDIEKGLQDFWNKVNNLQHIYKKVLMKQASLHFLLRRRNPETVQQFYRMLDLDPEQVPAPGPDVDANLQELQIPFALTNINRFFKLLCQAYQKLAFQVHSYMYGEYYNDPQEPRCKRVTVNYTQIQELCSSLQHKIHNANQCDTYTEVLQFAKRLNVEQNAKESLAGVPLQLNLDQELAYTPPELSNTDLKAYPSFPPLPRVKKDMKKFTSHLFAQAPVEAHSILQDIKAAQR